MRFMLWLVAVLAYGCSGLALSSSIFGDLDKGRDIYSRKCAACHGQDGRGKAGMAPDFVEEWHRFTQSDEVLAGHIRNEYSSPDGFYTVASCPQHVLNDEEMEDLLSYLRKLVDRMPGFDDFKEPDGFKDSF
ncbi:c-type cytochrome [Pseudomonadota bacterium]